MILYRENGVSGYKTPTMIDFDFIHPKTVVNRRPASTPLHNLTSENCEFLEKIGLKLKKAKC